MSSRKILVWVLAILICSIGISGTIAVTQNMALKSLWKFREYIDENKTISIENINQLNISSVSSAINIIPNNQQKDINIHLSGNAKISKDISKHLINITKNRDQLNIKIEHDPKIIGIFSFFSTRNLKLDIFMPENYQDSLTINSVSGDTSINNFSLKNINIKTVSGNISANSLNCNNIASHTTSGSVKLDNLYGTLDFGSVSGDLKLTKFTGNLSCSSVSGDINIDYKSFDNNITSNSVSGDISIIIPKESEFTATFKTLSGKFKNNVDYDNETSSKNRLFELRKGTKNNIINIKTTSGDFKLANKL